MYYIHTATGDFNRNGIAMQIMIGVVKPKGEMVIKEVQFAIPFTCTSIRKARHRRNSIALRIRPRVRWYRRSTQLNKMSLLCHVRMESTNVLMLQLIQV